MKVMGQQLEHIMAVAKRARCTFLVIVNGAVTPAVALVEECMQAGTEWISIKAWTPLTLPESPAAETKLALLVWDATTAHGYQVSGRAVRADPTAILDGYTPIENRRHFPQVEERILMLVEDVAELQGSR